MPSSLRLGAEFVRDAVSVGRPVLLRGFFAPEELRADWSRASLRSQAGGEGFQLMMFEPNGGAAGGAMRNAHEWRKARGPAWPPPLRCRSGANSLL